jgi:(5-formylfuran-3-yl)methyl phosphate synthase
MTRLLVSVTDAQEAILAVENGADLIDVKDPTAGSLGAATANQWQEVLCAVNDRVPVSAALGELLAEGALERARLTANLAFAKVGLAGCRNDASWTNRWRHWQQSLAPDTQAVAVCYVDWQTCGAPSPDEVIRELVATAYCRVMLFDTCDKGNGSLLDHCPLTPLRDLCENLRNENCQIVLAGSLRLADIPALLSFAPDYLAVRGAVCRGSRTGHVDGALVREWARALT